MYNLKAAISGGGEHSTFNTSIGYFDQKGIMEFSNFKKYNARVNGTFKKGRLTVGENLSDAYTNKEPQVRMVMGIPTVPMKDAEGRYVSAGTEYYVNEGKVTNPFASYSNAVRRNKAVNVTGSLTIGLCLLSGFDYRLVVGGDYISTHTSSRSMAYDSRWNATGQADPDYSRTIHSLSEGRGERLNYTIDNLLTYKNAFAGHTFDLLGGTSWMREYDRSMGIGSGSTDLGANFIAPYSFLSTAYGPIPSVFGENQSGQGSVLNGYVTKFAQEDLTWVKSISKNVALEMAFFGNRLSFTAEYFWKDNKDLLAPLLPLASSGQTIMTNGGDLPVFNSASVRNKGFEFTFGYRNTWQDWRVDVSANISALTNKVKSLGEGVQPTKAEVMMSGSFNDHAPEIVRPEGLKVTFLQGKDWEAEMGSKEATFGDQYEKAKGYKMCSRKWLDWTLPPTDDAGTHFFNGRAQEVNWRMIRYADVLLMYAEAVVQGGKAVAGITPSEAINQVRARAGLPPVAEVTMETIERERISTIPLPGNGSSACGSQPKPTDVRGNTSNMKLRKF